MVHSWGDALFLCLLVLPVALDINIGRRLRHAGANGERWRSRVALVGLIANCLAYLIPWGLLAYNVLLLGSGRPVSGSELVDPLFPLGLSLVLAGMSVIMGAIAPKYVRVQLVLSGICIVLLLLSIPMGIL